VEYECFDKPEPEWWVSGSEYRFIGKKVLGVDVKIVDGLIGVTSIEARKREEIDHMRRLLFQGTKELKWCGICCHHRLILHLMLNIDICWHDVLNDDC